mmetsp:Transcript_21636/g.26576  ORF Transcript_21636/g.26576 Transcript_21636/m.26576 type:complete len:81 (-) Transcript_21636:320-562(-)
MAGNGMDMSPGEMIVDMQMIFEFGYKAPYILFEGFVVDNIGLFFAALLFIFMLAIVTESISFLIWRQKFQASKEEGLSAG